MDKRRYAILPNTHPYTGDEYGDVIYKGDMGQEVRANVEPLHVIEYSGNAEGELLAHLDAYGFYDLSVAECGHLLSPGGGPVFEN